MNPELVPGCAGNEVPGCIFLELGCGLFNKHFQHVNTFLEKGQHAWLIHGWIFGGTDLKYTVNVTNNYVDNVGVALHVMIENVPNGVVAQRFVFNSYGPVVQLVFLDGVVVRF